MNKRKRTHGARIIFYFILAMALAAGCFRGYDMYRMERQITEAKQARDELLQEKESLQKQAEALQDPREIERKARDDLGMVKPGEVPYVK